MKTRYKFLLIGLHLSLLMTLGFISIVNNAQEIKSMRYSLHGETNAR